MATYKFTKDGGFAACSDAGNWAYAYPTSTHATMARKMPQRIAEEMARSADAFAHLPNVDAYNARIAAAE